MHKAAMTALGAGLLAIAVPALSGAVLANSASRGMQLDGTTGTLVSIASRGSRQREPASVTRRPAIVARPRVKTPGAARTPGGFQPSSCHRPTVIHATKTLMSALPEPRVCVGKVVHWHKLTYCYHCGGLPLTYDLSCVSCRPGYRFNAASKACCKGPIQAPMAK